MKRNRSSSVCCSSIEFCLLSSCYMFDYQVPLGILYTRCQFLKCARLINSSRKQFLIHWRQGFNPWLYRMEECCTLVVLGQITSSVSYAPKQSGSCAKVHPKYIGETGKSTKERCSRNIGTTTNHSQTAKPTQPSPWEEKTWTKDSFLPIAT